MSPLAEFFNASLCVGGAFENRPLYVDLSTGLIASAPSEVSGESAAEDDANAVEESYDLRGHVIAPAYIDIQANGAGGFSFNPAGGFSTDGAQASGYGGGLKRAARNLLSCGVGSFLATLPTLKPEDYQKILPELQPQAFSYGAELLGAHCEGPWLSPAHKGDHDSTLMQLPSKSSPDEVFGQSNMKTVKMVTVAPELPGAINMIVNLTWEHERVVSIGHSTGGVDVARFSYHCGAICVTHLFHAMAPPTSQDPGFMGWIASPAEPHFTVTADGRKAHPYLVAMAFRTNPKRCILVSDSCPLLGLPDGTYKQLAGPGFGGSSKQGNRILKPGTEDLIGSCVGLDECVRNLMKFARCSLAEAVQCATENVASLLSLSDRGRLEPGRRADFVILNDAGFVIEVWQGGKCTYRPPPT